MNTPTEGRSDTEFVTFRELVKREEELLERFKAMTNDRFDAFEHKQNAKLLKYGHDTANEMATLKEGLFQDLHSLLAPEPKDKKSDAPTPFGSVMSGVGYAANMSSGRMGWPAAVLGVGLFAIAAAFILFMIQQG